MAKWFQREQDDPNIPEEYRGMSNEDIINRLRNADAANQRITELEGKVSDADRLRQEFTDMKTRVEQQERERQQQSQRVYQQQQQDRPTSFLDDEERAFQERIAPYAAATLSLGEQMAKMNFSNSMSDPIEKRMFGKWAKEVDDLIAKEANPATRANPTAWDYAWGIVKSRHMPEIIKAARENNEFFSESSGGDSRGGPIRQEDPNMLTDEEKKLAAKFGLDEKEYLAQKKEMVIHHG